MTALRNAIINSSCLLHQDSLNYSNILRNEALNKIHYRRASVLILFQTALYCGYLFSSQEKAYDNPSYFISSFFLSSSLRLFLYWIIGLTELLTPSLTIEVAANVTQTSLPVVYKQMLQERQMAWAISSEFPAF